MIPLSLCVYDAELQEYVQALIYVCVQDSFSYSAGSLYISTPKAIWIEAS